MENQKLNRQELISDLKNFREKFDIEIEKITKKYGEAVLVIRDDEDRFSHFMILEERFYPKQ